MEKKSKNSQKNLIIAQNKKARHDYFIEEKFEVKVPPQDMTIENFMTVGAIGNYLERLKTA